MSYVSHSQFRKVAPAKVDQRESPRHDVQLQPARAQRKNCGSLSAVLSDLSIYGCRLAVAGEYRENSPLRIAINGSDWIDAEVVWCAEGKLGCRFNVTQNKEWVRQLTLHSM